MSNQLLDLARKFDATTDLEARIRIAEQMRPVLGDRHDSFDARFSALVEKWPAFPFAAETIVRAMGIARDGAKSAMYGSHTMMGCGCCLNGAKRIYQCDEHALRSALDHEG